MARVVKTEKTDKCFSSKGGLKLCATILNKLKLASKLSPNLPATQRNVFSGEHKFESLVLGFQSGNDHLDDWDESNEDPGFRSTVERCYSSKSLGDYLRSFTGYNLHMLQQELINLSFELRSKLECADTERFVLDLDSTLHAQYGKKMEGVEYCYKKFNALDSIVAFDELGLQYWHDVRPGSTYTSNGCGQIIHEVFSRMPTTRSQQRRLCRADSGFFTTEFFNACSAKGVGFVCAAKRTEYVMDKVFRIKNWEPQNPGKKGRILAKGGRECEIGHIVYHTGGYDGPLRLVVMRAEKRQEDGVLFKNHKEYDYYCFCTNMGAHEFSDVEIIKFYRGRGNAENFIKEQKYGFDLKHYPCLKLIANKAFGLIAAYAFTLTRFISLMSPSKKKTKEGIKKICHYSKRIRNRWLLIPAQVIRHAGSVSFRFNCRHYKEIVDWEKKLKILQFGYS